MEFSSHLFNNAFEKHSYFYFYFINSANLKNELLNKREQKSTKGNGRVSRYRPGVEPGRSIIDKKEESDISGESLLKPKEIKIVEKKDDRLERLKAAQNSKKCLPRRKRIEAEIILDEEEDEVPSPLTETPLKSNTIVLSELPEKEEVEDEEARRRRVLRARALDEEEEEFMNDITPVKEEGTYEYEYDEEESDEDEGTLFAVRHRPIFVPKINRRSIVDPVEQERQRQEAEELAEQKRLERIEMTQKMIEQENMREIEEDETAGTRKDPNTLEVIPDDTDDMDNEEEFQAWKRREFERIMSWRQKEEERLGEQAEKERREKMTDAELEEENRRLEEQGVRKGKKEHVQGTFMQKYYHKGIFYLDEESLQTEQDIRNRDFHAPTENDLVDKKTLPKIMQVRDWGKRSQSKWTYLRNEDTLKNADWLNEIQAKIQKKKFKQAGNK